MKIGFLGTSHLALNTGIAYSSRGDDILFVGIDPNDVELINAGELPLYEVGLDELFEKNRKRIQATTDFSQINNCDLVYLAHDIEIDQNNNSSYKVFDQYWDQAKNHLSSSQCFIVHSQLLMGKMQTMAKEIPETPFYYQVETLIFGRAIERVLEPERYIVGCEDPGRDFPPLYKKHLESFGCPILKMNYESAEISKMAINMYLCIDVTMTNTLSEICEKSKANWHEVKECLKLDQRIGPKAYLEPGLGISGGNLERDLKNIKNLSLELGGHSHIIDACLNNSEYRKQWVLRKIKELSRVIEIKKVAMWGVAYRPDTSSTRNSPSVKLLEEMPFMKFKTYDPKAKLNHDHPHVKEFSDKFDVLKDCNILVVMTPWDEFQQVSVDEILIHNPKLKILDPFRVLKQTYDRETIKMGLNEVTI